MPARSRNLGIGASCCFRPIFSCGPAPLVTLVPNQAEARYCVLTGATFGFFDDVHCRRQLHQRFTSRRKIRARLDRPGRREAAYHQVPSKDSRPTRETSVWFHHWQCGGIPRKGYPRCKSVEKKKTVSIGGSPWNTLGGNSENFIRPQTRRRDCTLYSQRSVGGRERCAEKISMARMAE